MSNSAITCAAVDERDLDTRYLSGQLTPEEAEEFEAHYFGCDRCWTLVRDGLDVRAGLERRKRPRWWGLAAAAGIALAALGIWSTGLLTIPRQPADTLRGSPAGLPVAATADAGALWAAWPRVSEADLYRVRLYAGDGALMLEREIADTSISVSREQLPQPTGAAELLWQIEALDRLRKPIVRSDLTPATAPAP